jgi:hypothetical protein
VNSYLDFVPHHLPVPIEPFQEELLSSWLLRVANANAISREELIEAAAVHSDNNVIVESRPVASSLDYQLNPEARQRLSVFCRIPETTITGLELCHHFPYHAPEWFHGRDLAPYRPHLSPRFCLECLLQQIRNERVLHVQANWAVPVLTHCPTHLLRLQNYCKSCCGTNPVEWLATAPFRKILCKHCFGPLSSEPDMELRDKGLIAVVSLQAVILTAARGVNPDTFWLGRISAQSFMQVVRDLIALLTHRQYGEGPLLAMRLAGDAFQCDSPLPRGIEQPPLFALHHSARVMVIAALAQVLLGSRRDRFFPSASTKWGGIPLLSHHRLTPDELQFVHDRAVDWPEELRRRILLNLPQRAMSDDWKILRSRTDPLLTNSHI